MEVRAYLRDLSHPAMIEAIYLCGRYLTHGLTPAKFERQLDSDVKTRYRAVSAKAVLDIMSAIEEQERSQIADLPADVRERYADEIGTYAWDDGPDADDEEIEKALSAFSGP